MWFGLILIMVAVPLLELALLIKLGQQIGFWATLAIIFLTAGIGIAILNAQGLAAFRRAMDSVSQGKPPVEPALDGFMLMMAGGLLLAPGLITDVAGLLLLIPPLRRLVANWGLKKMMASGSIHVGTWQRRDTYGPPPERGSAGGGRGTVIEGEFERIDEKKVEPRRGGGSPPRPYRNGHAKEP